MCSFGPSSILYSNNTCNSVLHIAFSNQIFPIAVLSPLGRSLQLCEGVQLPILPVQALLPCPPLQGVQGQGWSVHTTTTTHYPWVALSFCVVSDSCLCIVKIMNITILYAYMYMYTLAITRMFCEWKSQSSKKCGTLWSNFLRSGKDHDALKVPVEVFAVLLLQSNQHLQNSMLPKYFSNTVTVLYMYTQSCALYTAMQILLRVMVITRRAYRHCRKTPPRNHTSSAHPHCLVANTGALAPTECPPWSSSNTTPLIQSTLRSRTLYYTLSSSGSFLVMEDREAAPHSRVAPPPLPCSHGGSASPWQELSSWEKCGSLIETTWICCWKFVELDSRLHSLRPPLWRSSLSSTFTGSR